MDLKQNIPLAPYTTFNIGGPAKFFVEVHTLAEVQEALDWVNEHNEQIFILSGGSNILFRDEGFDGLVIKLGNNNIDINDTTIIAGAGAVLKDMIMQACHAGLTGMENMYGIPGCIGGAVRGNVEAFGTEVRDVLTTTTAIHTKTKEIRTFTPDECELGYRTSFFKTHTDWLIFEATFELKKRSAYDCVARANQTMDERNKRQLQNVQSAGSFFMNPSVPESIQKMFKEEKGVEARDGKVPAGWLTDKIGARGMCVGDACISEQHANYLINTGNATAREVRELSTKIKNIVSEKFGVQLQEEVHIL